MASLVDAKDTPDTTAFVVELTHAELLAAEAGDEAVIASCLGRIATAYGPDGIGLLTVSGVPGVIAAREALLLQAARLGALDADIKAKYERPEAFFGQGWSHGREKLEGGRADLAKGSWYGNPLMDAVDATPAERAEHASYCEPNRWPDAELPEMGPAFKAMGRLIVEVAERLAVLVDHYAASQHPPGAYEPGKLARIVSAKGSGAVCCKARLLHYFPPAVAGAGGDAAISRSDWCGWHNDHGALTGLVAGMYTDTEGAAAPRGPAGGAGLHVLTRGGKQLRVPFERDRLAFQLGEAAQIFSGGVLQATPHAVCGGAGGGASGSACEGTRHSFSRESFAVFCQPHWDEPMVPPGVTPAQAASAVTDDEGGGGAAAIQARVGARGADKLPPGLPPLLSRWDAKMNFGQFTNATINAYYK